MRILIANDDGIYSPGLLALAQVAREFGRVTIVAPDVERSSSSHSVTHNRPLSYRRTPLPGFDAYRADGTPADCVALGLSLFDKAELVLSGINLGLNVGNAMWHSGTLAAAKQASLMGVRGIALSTSVTGDDPDFQSLKPHVMQALHLLTRESTARLLNVNFPDHPTGVRWTRQSVRHYDGVVIPTKDPFGRELYWYTVRPVETTEEGTDRWALEHGYTSITPLHLDLTDHAALADLTPTLDTPG